MHSQVQQIKKLVKAGKLEAALKKLKKLNKKQGKTFELLQLEAIIHSNEGRKKEAIKYFYAAARIKPEDVQNWFNIGTTLISDGNLDEGVECLSRVVELSPNFASAHFNLANSFRKQGKFREAAHHYQSCIDLKQHVFESRINLGITLKSAGALHEALVHFEEARAMRPASPVAHQNIGEIYSQLKDYRKARKSYLNAIESLTLDDASASISSLYALARKNCDFELFRDLEERIGSSGVVSEKVMPLTGMLIEDDPQIQRKRSEHLTSQFKVNPAGSLNESKTQSNGKIKLGYFSADFHDHPCAQLLVRVLELHDRDKFEVVAYSYGPATEDEMRNRVRNAVDEFVDISSFSDSKLRARINHDGVDVLININGYTENNRTQAIIDRICKLQINYLGFPGTLASEAFDYIIADKTVIPYELKHHYSESVIYLPDSYLPMDDMRELATNCMNRAQFGLGNDDFVFAVTCRLHKIGTRELAAWSEILRQVSNSKLWLSSGSQEAMENLSLAFERKGISASRLVYAPRLDKKGYLSRHRVADLGLDTLSYNGHTTTGDLLWSGLPTLTLEGSQFAARVSSSLLRSARMSEFITFSESEYVERAVNLATAREELLLAKQHLDDNRFSLRLFDTSRYTRNLEAGFISALNKVKNGRPTCDIEVADLLSPSK